ncbi:MAG: hypothetical protein GVY15_11430 [Bacteroidetes bacterium]|nr:hypothetical protein [Bacteroidota bacterium]
MALLPMPLLSLLQRLRPPVRLSAGLMLVLFVWISGVGPAPAQVVELPHDDDTPGTFFGSAVAIEPGRAVVAAPNESSCAAEAGAAYVFERSGEQQRWEQVATLLPSNCEEGLFFGRAVALSGDRILVTASREFFATQRPNSVYVFERTADGQWEEQTQLRADPGQRREGSFGADVALDGDRALVTTWADTNAGAEGGAAYIFEFTGNRWERTARLTAEGIRDGDVFGGSAALDGDRLAVSSARHGDNGRGSVFVFERSPAARTWDLVARVPDVEDFFISLALDGPRLAVGESRAGRRGSGVVRIIGPDARGTWREQARIESPRPYRGGAFGTEVALRGDWLLATGFDEQFQLNTNIDRAVFAFRYHQDTAAWRFEHVMDMGSPSFGAAIDLKGQTAIVGESSQDDRGRAFVIRIPVPAPSAERE